MSSRRVAGSQWLSRCDAHHHHRHAGDLDDRAERNRAADARLVPRAVEPVPARLEPDQERSRQGNVADDPGAVEAEAVGLAGVDALLVDVAEIELEELDGVGITLAEAAGEIGDAVAVARARHALIDLGEKRDVDMGAPQRRFDRVDMPKALDIPTGYPRRAFDTCTARPCTAGLDLAQCRQAIEEDAVRVLVSGAGADGIPFGERDLAELGDGFRHRCVDPIGHRQRLPTASGRSSLRAGAAAAAHVRTISIGATPFR